MPLADNQQKQQSLEGLSLLMVGVVAISFAAPLFKLSQPVHPLVAAATRLSLAAILWFGVTLWRARGGMIKRSHLYGRQGRVAMLCGLCYAVHFGAWVWSLGLTSVIASATLVTTTPIMLGFVAWLKGRDRPSGRLIKSGLIATMGVILFAFDSQGGEGRLSGDLLALLGALAMVPYLLMTRGLGDSLRLAPFSLIATSVGAITLWVIAAIALPPEQLTFPQGSPLYALIAAALVPQMIGHSALTVSLKRFTPTEVGIATLLEPLGASLLAWIWLKEPQSLSSLIAALITLGAVMNALPKYDRE